MIENQQKQQRAEVDTQILQVLKLLDTNSKITVLAMFKEILKILNISVKKKQL